MLRCYCVTEVVSPWDFASLVSPWETKPTVQTDPVSCLDCGRGCIQNEYVDLAVSFIQVFPSFFVSRHGTPLLLQVVWMRARTLPTLSFPLH
jgi:hypothetical protein